MKQIHISRNNGTVTFEEVSMDNTEMVYFTNLDPQEAHWPSLTTNQLGPAPSPNSNQCALPQDALPFSYTYTCLIAGHENEQGIVNVNGILAASVSQLSAATVNQAIAVQQVVEGGFSPYSISGELYQVVDGSGNILQQGSGSIGPGLLLNPMNGNEGITVSGVPTAVGTYNFTFTVNDAAQHNLQQAQYSMIVSA